MSPRGWREAFTDGELRELRRVSNLEGAWMIAVNWLWIIGSLALVAWLPNPLTFVVAVVVIGARQLGLAIVMHEAAHRTLFTHRVLNDVLANWLAAYWVFLGVELYRPYHLQHHLHTATDRDPDLSLKAGYPTTRRAMARKIARDLLGIVGVRRLIGTFALLASAVIGRRHRSGTGVSFLGSQASRAHAAKALAGFAVTQLGLLAFTWIVLGRPELFLVWAVAWLTTQNLVTRLRSIAEHAMTPETKDPFQNTRTVRANWLARLLVAPNRVNYHLEHHLLMNVPHHSLPAFHRMLAERGLLDGARVSDGYGAVLREASSRR